MNIPEWDETYMNMCYEVARHSPDESTQSGCYIAHHTNEPISFGYNDLPRGVENTPAVQQHPEKYRFFEHAERNAFNAAARNGKSCFGAKLYVNWLPCTPCAGGIIAQGISEVIVHQQGQMAFKMSRNDEVWDADHDEVLGVFAKAGVRFRWYTGPIRVGLTGMWSGKHYALNGRLPVELPEGSSAIWSASF